MGTKETVNSQSNGGMAKLTKEIKVQKVDDSNGQKGESEPHVFQSQASRRRSSIDQPKPEEPVVVPVGPNADIGKVDAKKTEKLEASKVEPKKETDVRMESVAPKKTKEVSEVESTAVKAPEIHKPVAPVPVVTAPISAVAPTSTTSAPTTTKAPVPTAMPAMVSATSTTALSAGRPVTPAQAADSASCRCVIQ